MAAARNHASSTGTDFSNFQRSLSTQVQSPIIAVPSKSPRELVKQHNIPRRYDPVGYVSLALRLLWIKLKYKAEESSYTSAPTKQIDQPSTGHCLDEDQPWSKGLPMRTGLNSTGEGKSDQEGHNYVDEFQNYWDELQIRETLYSLSLLQNDPKRFWALFDMDPETQLEMLFPLDRAKSSLHVQLDVEVKGTQAGLAMAQAEFFGLNVRQRGIYQPTNDQHSRKGRCEKWSNNVRFCDNGFSSMGVFTGRLDIQANIHLFPKKMSFRAPYNSTSSAEIGESDMLSHCVSKETIAPGELDLVGRNWIRRWKIGPGRDKDWRSSRYLKSMRIGEWAKYQLSSQGRRSYLNPSKAADYYLAIAQAPPHIAVPKDMLRQKSRSCQRHSSYLRPKSSWQAMNEAGLNQKTSFLRKSRARCEPPMTGPIDSLDIEEARRPNDTISADSDVSNTTIDELLTAMASTFTETSSLKIESPSAKIISLNHLLAPESFVDTILGACLRLKRLVRAELYYEVYDAESLSDGNQKYEVRAYNLRGLSLKVRQYSIRNLKRASARSSCIGSLDQGGKKWLVFANARADLVPEPFEDYGPLWRTRDEYERAFPILEPQKPHNSENIEKEVLQDRVVVEAYDASSENPLGKELSKSKGTYPDPETVRRLRQLLVASFKSCHTYEKFTLLPEKPKKIKSPEQGKRLRDRQRLSRQTKRKAKAALTTGADGDSIFQTLDMIQGPRGEFSGNKDNHVATNHTIDKDLHRHF